MTHLDHDFAAGSLASAGPRPNGVGNLATRKKNPTS
jgi:hypothetical protein